MQLNGKSGNVTLVDLRRGQQAIVAALDVPEDIARRLMELGFLPGGTVRAGQAAPGGCPRVYEIDGSEVALRCDTARKIRLENAQAPPGDSR